MNPAFYLGLWLTPKNKQIQDWKYALNGLGLRAGTSLADAYSDILICKSTNAMICFSIFFSVTDISTLSLTVCKDFTLKVPFVIFKIISTLLIISSFQRCLSKTVECKFAMQQICLVPCFRFLYTFYSPEISSATKENKNQFVSKTNTVNNFVGSPPPSATVCSWF